MKTIHIEEGSGVGSGQTFCRQSRVGSGQRFGGSGPRKVTRGQLWVLHRSQTPLPFAELPDNFHCDVYTPIHNYGHPLIFFYTAIGGSWGYSNLQLDTICVAGRGNLWSYFLYVLFWFIDDLLYSGSLPQPQNKLRLLPTNKLRLLLQNKLHLLPHLRH